VSFRLCIDIGGTFTDLAIVEDGGELSVFKSPTTPTDYVEGIMNVLSLASEHYKISLSKLLEECSTTNGGLFAHGSTISTNAIIEHKTAKTGLICTKGFRDVLLVREGGKEEPYNWAVDYPLPYVPRHLTLPVTERINAEGGIEIPLNEDEVRQVIRQFKELKVEAIAVSLLWSIVNPAHELRIGEIIEEEWPGIHYTLGHRLNPIIREYRRTSSAVINASLAPLITRYTADLDKRLKEKGYRGEITMLTSAGGMMSAEELISQPIYSVDNGPAMAPIAGRIFASRELDVDDVITVDMGGTSFDLSLVTKGEIALYKEAIVADTMLGISKVDCRSIGAGGGSIAWVDPGGLLHVGPQSAGAVPGPACYGHRGEEPTVTDANLVLGYLNPDYFLGGAIKLDLHLAEEVIQQKVGKPLNLGLTEAAFSLWSVVNINMVAAINGITIWRGIDPREYLFVSGGGASGLHICHIMKELSAKRCLVPKFAGALSAVGGIFADIVSEYNVNYYTTSNNFDYEGVNRTLENLEKQGEAFFEREGVDPTNRKLEFYVDAHYSYQTWDITVPLRGNRIHDERELGQLLDNFHEVHERFYGIKEPGQYIECICWKVRATGLTPSPEMEDTPLVSGDASGALVGKRKAFFKDSGGMIDTPVYRGGKLLPGMEIAGPAIIEEPITTVVLLTGSKARVTKLNNYLLELD
jgi:N-methylhydantoinase A